MMGADSVAYHRETIMERADDFPGAGLEYYASRGETPLLWGGMGAESRRLVGPVDNPSYDAIYGPGRACNPATGERMVSARRPGMSWSSPPTSRWPSWVSSVRSSTCTPSWMPNGTPRWGIWTN